MKRRTFLSNSISVSLLSFGGIAAYQYYQQSLQQVPQEDNFEYSFLNQDDRILLQVLVPVFVSNNVLNNPLASSMVIQNIDTAITHLGQKTQAELKELFELLASVFGRLLVARVWFNWQLAADDSIDQFLTDWRESRFELLQIAYKGLHKLVIGSAYAEENTWSAIGYPGPPQID